jgi:hypothetical protein
VSRGEEHYDLQALRFPIAGANCPTMPFNNSICDSQTKTGSTRLAITGLCDPIKGLKDVHKFGFRNP